MSIRVVTFAGALVSSLNLINQVFLPGFVFLSLPRSPSMLAFRLLLCSCSWFCLNEAELEEGMDAHRDNTW